MFMGHATYKDALMVKQQWKQAIVFRWILAEQNQAVGLNEKSPSDFVCGLFCCSEREN
jgi:hypothetical protein